MKTITSVGHINEAMLIRSRLEAEGISAFIPDEHTIQMRLHLTNAFGGVRIQVPEDQAQDALEVLKEMGGITEKSSTPCPYCGSEDTVWDNTSKGWAQLFVVLLSLPIPFSVRLKCNSCNASWKHAKEKG